MQSTRQPFLIVWDRSLLRYLEIIHNLESKLSRDKKHQNNIRKILRFLSLHGVSPASEIVEQCFQKANFRQQTTTVQRIMKGRTDRRKYSKGLIKEKLVNKFKINNKNHYELTLYGILYSIRINTFSKNEFLKLAENNIDILPKIFGKAELLKKYGFDLTGLNEISKLDSLRLFSPNSAIFWFSDLTKYLLSKHSTIVTTREGFANFISLWFYTNLLNYNKSKPKQSIKIFHKLIKSDNDLSLWYSGFLIEAAHHYEKSSKQLLEDFGME